MNKEMKIFRTTKDNEDRLTQKNNILFTNKQGCGEVIITIDETSQYQTILGFGGAFTEAGGYTLTALDKEERDKILKAYFHPTEGHDYSLCRTHINSCDFSLGNYAYCDVEGDMELINFSIERDKKYLVPFIKSAMSFKNKNLKILASPWSPPKWMKTNGEMNNGGFLKPQCREAWAKYYVKYINSYKEEDIDIWGVSVQNEPAAVQTWDSCVYSAEEERDFVKQHLGPALEKCEMGDKKIVVWDHNRDEVVERANVVLSDEEASKYIWGVGVHWYEGEEHDNLTKVHNMFPKANILFTEGCNEGGVKIGAWETGERYGSNIIGDLNNWAVGWIDWNMVLDHNGGPNHVGNYCDAPIIINTETKEVTYQSSYYYLGHFSRFIKSGAIRIKHNKSADDLLTVSFKNKDNSIVTILMNNSDNDKNVQINCTQGIASVYCPKHSIATLIY